MIRITHSNLYNQTATSRLICQDALNRGWKVRTPSLPSPHMFIDRGDGDELHIFSATPPTVSFAWASLVNNKYATYSILLDNGIEQLGTMLALGDNSDEAMKFLNTHGKIVAKPVDGGHGNGITVNIEDVDTLSSAIKFAEQYNRTQGKVLLQEQFIADTIIDIRVTVIAGEVAAAIERVPARVKGDGIHSIKELIEIENGNPERGEPYRAKLAKIDIERARTYLGEQMDDVPPYGEMRSVLGVANYGAGGELLDVSDDIPKWLANEAVHAAQVLGLDVAGVDYMIDRRVNTTMDRSETRAVITEVNKCPSLSIHDEPTVGTNRQTVRQYLDFIAQL